MTHMHSDGASSWEVIGLLARTDSAPQHQKTMAKVCAKPGCWRLQPCPRKDHKPKGTRDPAKIKLYRSRYATPEYKRFKQAVLKRSGGKCEVKINGRRCNSTDRVQPHHILPLEDGGTHDPDTNGLAACRPHHIQLDRQARRRRRQRA